MRSRGVILAQSAVVSLATAQSLATSLPAIGDLIAQGIGAATTQSSTVSSTQSLRLTNSSSAIATQTVGGDVKVYNCTDSACGLACSSSWSSWSSASKNWLSAFATTSTSVVSYYNATVTAVPVATSNGSVYATCNGIPRYTGAVNYWTTTNSSIPATSTTWYEIITATGEAFSEPTPSCIIAGTQCDDLVSEWHASNYLAFPFNQSTGSYDYWPNGPPTDFPHCNTSDSEHATGFSAWLNETFLADGSGCWIKGARARLFYWPEAVIESNKTETCPDGPYTPAPGVIPANATAPATKVVTLSETGYNCCTTTVTMTSPTMYLSMQDVEARDASWAFAGQGPIPATVVPIAPSDLISQVIAPPLITNEALSSSAMSVIAHQEFEKYTDLFGYNWQQYQSGLGGPNIPLQTVIANPADLGKPPQPLSYYFGAAGWYCLNADPFALHYQPVSAGLPPGMKCDTIYDDYYRPWVQIPSTMKSVHRWSTCNLMFGWDPPIALTAAATVAGPSMPGKVSATKTSDSAAETTPATPGSPSLTVTTPTAEPDHTSNGDPTTGKSTDPSRQPPASPTTASPAFLTPLVQPSPAAPAQEVGQSTDETTRMSPAVFGTVGSCGTAVTIASDLSNSCHVIATSAGGATTLHAGDQGIVASQHLSVDSTGGVIVYSATTVDVGNGAKIGQIVSVVPMTSASVTAVLVDGLTLVVGGSPATAHSVTYSALPSGSGIVAASDGGTSTHAPSGGGSVIDLDSGQHAELMPISGNSVPTMTINGQTISAVPNGVVVDGTTVTKIGSVQTIKGVAYSLDSDGQLVVAGSSTLGNGGYGNLIGAIETAANSMLNGTSVSTSTSQSRPTSSTDSSQTTTAPSRGGSTTATASATSSTRNAASPGGRARGYGGSGTLSAIAAILYIAC